MHGRCQRALATDQVEPGKSVVVADTVNDNEQQPKRRSTDDTRRSTARDAVGVGLLRQVWAFLAACLRRRPDPVGS